MPLVRLLFFILLLVNLFAFALLQGWLGVAGHVANRSG